MDQNPSWDALKPLAAPAWESMKPVGDDDWSVSVGHQPKPKEENFAQRALSATSSGLRTLGQKADAFLAAHPSVLQALPTAFQGPVALARMAGAQPSTVANESATTTDLLKHPAQNARPLAVTAATLAAPELSPLKLALTAGVASGAGSGIETLAGNPQSPGQAAQDALTDAALTGTFHRMFGGNRGSMSPEQQALYDEAQRLRLHLPVEEFLNGPGKIIAQLTTKLANFPLLGQLAKSKSAAQTEAQLKAELEKQFKNLGPESRQVLGEKLKAAARAAKSNIFNSARPEDVINQIGRTGQTEAQTATNALRITPPPTSAPPPPLSITTAFERSPEATIRQLHTAERPPVPAGLLPQPTRFYAGDAGIADTAQTYIHDFDLPNRGIVVGPGEALPVPPQPGLYGNGRQAPGTFDPGTVATPDLAANMGVGARPPANKVGVYSKDGRVPPPKPGLPDIPVPPSAAEIRAEMAAKKAGAPSPITPPPVPMPTPPEQTALNTGVTRRAAERAAQMKTDAEAAAAAQRMVANQSVTGTKTMPNGMPTAEALRSHWISDYILPKAAKTSEIDPRGIISRLSEAENNGVLQVLNTTPEHATQIRNLRTLGELAKINPNTEANSHFAGQIMNAVRFAVSTGSALAATHAATALAVEPIGYLLSRALSSPTTAKLILEGFAKPATAQNLAALTTLLIRQSGADQKTKDAAAAKAREVANNLVDDKNRAVTLANKFTKK